VTAARDELRAMLASDGVRLLLDRAPDVVFADVDAQRVHGLLHVTVTAVPQQPAR